MGRDSGWVVRMMSFRIMLVFFVLMHVSVAALADSAVGIPTGQSVAGAQFPARIARDPILAALPVLPAQPEGVPFSGQASVATTDVLTLSARAREFRHLLGDFLHQGGATVLRVGGAFLPEQPEPGLQFSIDPDTEEVFVGWRFQF